MSCKVGGGAQSFWTVAHHAPLSVGICTDRILEWVAIPFSRVSSRRGDETRISRNGRQILYH